MANTIITKNSATAAAVPTAGQLVQGELAVNVTDKRLFTENSGGTVVELGVNPSSLTLTSGTANGVTYLNGSKVLTSGSALTFDGTTLVSGTGIRANSYMEIRSNTAALYWENAANTLYWAQKLTGSDFAWDYFNGSSTTEAMRLTSTGLGIGTSSPTQALTVNGQMLSIASSGASFKNITPTTGNNYMWLGNTGNNLYVGKESSAGGTLFVGSSAYAGVIGNDGAYSLQFATNNNVRATIDSSGNLGLGNTPSATSAAGYTAFELGTSAGTGLTGNNGDLYVNENAYVNGGAWKYAASSIASAQYNLGGGVHRWFNAAAGTAGNAISFTQAMTLDASGNLGVGTSSPNARLDVASSSGSAGQVNTHVMLTRGTSIGAYLATERAAATNDVSALIFGVNSAERARIDSNGALCINRTDQQNDERLAVLGNVGQQCMSLKSPITTAYDMINIINGNGQVGTIQTNGSATSYNTSSDYRLKENVVTEWDATTRLKQLKPSRFNFIADADTTVDGFLAHEVQEIVPEAITGTKDAVDADGNPKYQGIDQSKLVPLLVKTIQELEARLTALEGN